MRWLVWRQHRYEIVGLLLVGIAAAVGLVYGAEYTLRVRQELGSENCQPFFPPPSLHCAQLRIEADQRIQVLRWFVTAVIFLPAMAGSFVGAPLFARELERGTHRLAWTQATTRMRWGGAKLVGVLAAAAVGAAIIAAFGGLSSRITRPEGYLPPFQNFDTEGPAFVSRVVFAIALAAFVGTLSRRVLTGMFVGPLLAIGVWVGVSFTLRPNYEPPITSVYSEANPSPEEAIPPYSWVLVDDYIDSNGNPVPGERLMLLFHSCPSRFATFGSGPREVGDPTACLAANDARQHHLFHPPDRYWRFQWTEAFLFLALAGACAAGSLLLLKRRDA